MTKLSPGRWADVRALYEGGNLAARDIAQRFGITDRGLLQKARCEGWVRKAPAARRARGAAGPDAAVQPGHPTRKVREALIRRLYKAIDIKLRHWEDRMKRGEELSAADSERMAKEITTMINGFETVAETEGALERRDNEPAVTAGGRGKRASDRAAGAAAAGADAERMRREIAERLERLRHGGSGGEGAG